MKLSAARLDVLVWTLVYGGLLVIGVGIALQRNGDAYGSGIVVAGAAIVAIGIVFVWLRSRVREPRS